MVLCQPNIQITRTTSFRRVSNAKPPLYKSSSPKEIVFVSTTVISSGGHNEKPNASGLTADQTRALPERTVDPDGPEARIIRSLRELYSCKAQSVRTVLPPKVSDTLKSEFYQRRDHMKFILKTPSSMTLLASPAGWALFVLILMPCQRYVSHVTPAPNWQGKVTPAQRYTYSSPFLPHILYCSSFPAPKYKNSACYRTRLKHLPTYSLSIRTSHFSATPRPLRHSRFDFCQFLFCFVSASYNHSDLFFAAPTQVVNALLTLQLNGANQITRHTEEWDHNRETTADGGFLGMLNEHHKRKTCSCPRRDDL